MRPALVSACAVLLGLSIGSDVAAQGMPKPAGCSHQPTTDWAQRIDACGAALKNPEATSHELAVAHENRGYAYRQSGKLDDAMRDYDEAIRLDPTYALPYDGRAAVLATRGDLDRAIAQITEALKRDPNSADLHGDKGSFLQQKGDLAGAAAELKEAIRLDPSRPVPHYTRALVERLRGDLAGAIAELNTDVRLEPDERDSFFERGLTRLYAGDRPGALSDLETARTFGPENAYTAIWLDVAHVRSGQPGSLRQASAVLDKTGWPAPVVAMLLGETTPASALAAATNPDFLVTKDQTCEATFYAGILALRQGKKTDAAALFRTAARDCRPSFDETFAAGFELKALGDKS